jgi:HTH-type transcriptional regulator/antitoxin HigA
MAADTNQGDEKLHFEPDFAVAPGEMLAEVLEEQYMTQADLARRLGVSTKHVYQVINGAAPVSSELAIALERVTGVAAGLWNGLEANYRDFLAREAEDDELHDQVGWLTELPIRAMVKRGLILSMHGVFVASSMQSAR